MIAVATPTDQEISRDFQELLGELTTRLQCRLRHFGTDWRAELVAEGIAIGWASYRSARLRGKQVRVRTLAWYAAKSAAAGRKLAGSSDLDALSGSPRAVAQVGRAVSLSDLGREAITAGEFTLLFADRRCKWTAPDVVIPKMLLDQLLDESDEPDRRIVQEMLQGQSQKEVARKLAVSPARVCQRLRGLWQRWQALAEA